MPVAEQMETIPAMVEAFRAGKMTLGAFVAALTAMHLSAAGIEAIAAAARLCASMPASAAPLFEQVATPLSHQSGQALSEAQGNEVERRSYAEHAVVEDSLYPEPFVGRDAIMTRTHGRLPAIPDLKITTTNRVTHGNQVSTEWIATGTHLGDLPGLPASGHSFSIPGVTVVVRHNGEIVRESLYYDMENVRQQLRP
jgi:steroid delta-isomerase-like uncharacterized protein